MDATSTIIAHLRTAQHWQRVLAGRSSVTVDTRADAENRTRLTEVVVTHTALADATRTAFHFRADSPERNANEALRMNDHFTRLHAAVERHWHNG